MRKTGRQEAGVKKQKKAPVLLDRGFPVGLPDSDLLSHRLRHYHRRRGVSQSCSGWEGVVPPCCGRQALNLQGKEPLPPQSGTKHKLLLYVYT